MSVHDFDWYGDRLDVAKWESQEVGARSAFFNCPVHGGSDSLHVTEKNGMALLNCFACGASAIAITEAVEDADAKDEAPKEEAAITVTRSAGARGRQQDSPGGRGAERGVRLSPASTITPLAWMAARCGLDLADLEKFPISEDGAELVFEFEGVDAEKRRGIGEGKGGKKYRWIGSSVPPLWPVPDEPGEDIVVCEGEADAICLARSGYEAYSVTKGSAGQVPAPVWEALSASGVRSAWLVFDLDDAGRKGRALAAEGARAAGLVVKEGRVAGIRPLEGETDARDVALRQGYPLVVEHDADEDDPVLLSDIEAVEPEDMWLDRIHPLEHTILFGDGGAGKGVIAAWWIARLTQDGKRVLVVDYEYHANLEWRPRIEGFGGDMSMVAIVQPTRPIWDIAAWLKEKADAFDIIVVDSVTYACVGDEVEKSVTATKYSMAVNTLGKPVLSIAHVTKADADPNHPFGSVFWSNGARVTIAVSRRVADDQESERLMRNPKTNQRGPFHPVTIEWDWLDQPGPPGCSDPKHGEHRHLHEKKFSKGVVKILEETYLQLRANLDRDPSREEWEARVERDYPDANFKHSTITTKMSETRKRFEPIGLVRGKGDPASGNVATDLVR